MPKPALPLIPADGGPNTPVLQPVSDGLPSDVQSALAQLRTVAFDFSQRDTVDIRTFLRKWDEADVVVAFDRHSDCLALLKSKRRSPGEAVGMCGVIVANEEQAKTLRNGLYARWHGDPFKFHMARWVAHLRTLSMPPCMPH
jgi:hypothetical protein